MREKYLGSPEDVHYIQRYLKAIRSVDPIEIATIDNPLRLSDKALEEFIDCKLFKSVVSDVLSDIQAETGLRSEAIAPKRYLVGIPKNNELGGFHDVRSVGYHHWTHAGFVMLLNPNEVPTCTLRTLELAKNYLHDCMHHATYRTFRRAIRIPASTREFAKARVPEVYREQYGINFRNKDGYSYSSPELTKLSPQAINLNLLMDGLIVLTIARSMRKRCSSMVLSSRMEHSLYDELLLDQPEDIERYHPLVQKYVSDIVIPTERFISRWGGEVFRKHILRAMYTGELASLKKYFAKQREMKGAWEKVFKNEGFQL